MENGILVRVGDQEALTGAMTLLAENDELREKPEANALKDSGKFKTENVIAQWKSLFK